MKPAVNSTFDSKVSRLRELYLLIENILPILEKHLGKENVSNSINTCRGIIIDYFWNMHGKTPSLKETRAELEKIEKLTGELYRALRNIGGGADQALWNSYITQSCVEPGDKPAAHTEVESVLMNFREVAHIALSELPVNRGWPKQLVPIRDLIQDLAKLYQRSTGKHPVIGSMIPKYIKVEEGGGKETIKYFYEGEFFSLVEEVVFALGVEKSNQALGKNIKEALQDMPDRH